MTPPLSSGSQTTDYPRRIVSEIIHSLSQPLTSLQICLEVSLMGDQSNELLRASIASALKTAEAMSEWLKQLRAEVNAKLDSGNSEHTTLDSFRTKL